MLTITITVDCPGWMAQGVKEYLALTLEHYGDTRVVDVQTDEPALPMTGQVGIDGG